MALRSENVAHRAGAFKQQNKTHKHGRHKSNRSLESVNKGKVNIKAFTTKKQHLLKKMERRNQLQQLRKLKREEATERKRSLGGFGAPPFLTAVVSVSATEDPLKFLEVLKGCDDSAIVTHSSQGYCHISLPRFKKRYSFVLPQQGDIYSVLDATKVADTVVLLYSLDSGFDDVGDTILSVLFAQGLPSPIHVIQVGSFGNIIHFFSCVKTSATKMISTTHLRSKTLESKNSAKDHFTKFPVTRLSLNRSAVLHTITPLFLLPQFLTENRDLCKNTKVVEGGGKKLWQPPFSDFQETLPPSFQIRFFFSTQGLEAIAVKQRSEAKKQITKILESRFPGDKIHSVDKKEDAILLLRQIANQKRRPVSYRDARPHLLAESLEFCHGDDQDLVGTLKVSGYLRGQQLSVNSLVHIPGHGDFQMVQIDAPDDPHPLVLKTRDGSNSVEMAEQSPKVLEKADPLKQESLQSENIPDSMDAEQTWPTAEELAEAEGTAVCPQGTPKKKVVKKVPKGTSEYQACWILDDDEGNSDNEESEDSGEEGEGFEAMSEEGDSDADNATIADDTESVSVSSMAENVQPKSACKYFKNAKNIAQFFFSACSVRCFIPPQLSVFSEVPLQHRFVFTLAARKVYDRSIHGRGNNGNVRIDKNKQIKVNLGGFANMFAHTPVEIVAALEIVCRLGKHPLERKSAVCSFIFGSRVRFLLYEKLLKPVQYALLVLQNGFIAPLTRFRQESSSVGRGHREYRRNVDAAPSAPWPLCVLCASVTRLLHFLVCRFSSLSFASLEKGEGTQGSPRASFVSIEGAFSKLRVILTGNKECQLTRRTWESTCFISDLFVLLRFFSCFFYSCTHLPNKVSISFSMYLCHYSLSDHKYQSYKDNLIRCPLVFILYSQKKADKLLCAQIYAKKKRKLNFKINTEKSTLNFEKRETENAEPYIYIPELSSTSNTSKKRHPIFYIKRMVNRNLDRDTKYKCCELFQLCMKVVFVQYFRSEKKQMQFIKYGNKKRLVDKPATKQWKKRRILERASGMRLRRTVSVERSRMYAAALRSYTGSRTRPVPSVSKAFGAGLAGDLAIWRYGSAKWLSQNISPSLEVPFPLDLARRSFSSLKVSMARRILYIQTEKIQKIWYEQFYWYRGLKSFHSSPWDPKENLPFDYARVFQFENFSRTKKRVMAEERDGAMPGWYITLHLANVPRSVYEAFRKGGGEPLVLFGLLPYEQKMSVLHVAVKRHPGFTEPIKSKERLVFHVGYRRFATCPIFSAHTNGDKHKYERFLRSDTVSVATMFAPIIFPPVSAVVFKEAPGGEHQLVGSGAVLGANPDRVVVKRAVLSGHPFKINRKSAVVRYMFFNRDDILWFKPVELKTKYGRRGHIKEPLGTHGHMKCVFNGQLKSQDTVLMHLYKRVFPKWTYDPDVPRPEPHYQSHETAGSKACELME
ncbi:unnamed protein product [Ixodes pacificus]